MRYEYSPKEYILGVLVELDRFIYEEALSQESAQRDPMIEWLLEDFAAQYRLKSAFIRCRAAIAQGSYLETALAKYNMQNKLTR